MKRYAAFLADLDFHVNATASRLISRHPVLGRQQLRVAPATLFNITVTGDGGDRVNFFMRSDNLYILGFTNKHGSLFRFRVQGDQYRMPASTSLSFGGGYPDMFNQGARGLLNLKISKKEAQGHLKTLANYQGGADQGLIHPLAFFVLIICEAERFAPIRAAVMERWENKVARNIDNTYPGSSNTFLLDLVVNWRTFSCAILSWSQHGQTPAAWGATSEAQDIRAFRVFSAQDALSVINPIIQPAPRRCSWN